MKKILLKCIVSISVLLIIITTCGSAVNKVYAMDSEVNDYSIAYYDNGIITYKNKGDGTDENSIFELGSNGKVVCAYIALKLVDEGKIGLNDKITPYLDSELITKDERLQEVTLKELLCHTAGFSPSYELGIDKNIYSNPGEEFRYSGVGYIYLQNVIENVSQMTIEDVAKHYVFEPLGMNNSTFEHTKTVTPYINMSSVVVYSLVVFIIVFVILYILAAIFGKITKYKFFSLKKGLFISFILAGIVNIVFLLCILSKVVIVFGIYYLAVGIFLLCMRKKKKIFYLGIPAITLAIILLGFTIPASIPVTNDLIHRKANCAYSLKSTSKDMAIFSEELMQEYNSSSEQWTIKEMFSEAVNIDETNSWGLGIAIESEENEKTYWHSGINPGFQSLLILCPSKDKYIVVVTNSDNGLDFSKEMARAFFNIDGKWDIPR